MNRLTIRLFGGIQLARAEEVWQPTALRSETAARPVPLQPAVQEFLAYLLLNRHRTHCREVLSGLFWGERDENQARRCLNTTLWRLRQELEPEGTPRGTFVLTTATGEIGFNRESDYWLDVAAYEETVRQCLERAPASADAEVAQQLAFATELYVGDLLEGCYEEWVLSHRERLRVLYVKALRWLMRYHREHEAYEQSLVYGRKILELDPLREEVHRALMRLYDLNGERSQALQQFERCREVLAQELDVAPMPETVALYRRLAAQTRQRAGGQVAAGQNGATIEQTTSGEPGAKQVDQQGLVQAMQQLDQALLDLEAVRGQVNRARQAVLRLIKHA